jgi:phage-related protein
MNGKVLCARFFKLSTGKEPVRDWLKSQTKETKKVIGEDINAIERTWPIGFPLVRKLDNDLWEVRSSLEAGIGRVFFTVWENSMVLLHGIIKKTQKTPKRDLDLAKKRRNAVLAGGLGNDE